MAIIYTKLSELINLHYLNIYSIVRSKYIWAYICGVSSFSFGGKGIKKVYII